MAPPSFFLPPSSPPAFLPFAGVLRAPGPLVPPSPSRRQLRGMVGSRSPILDEGAPSPVWSTLLETVKTSLHAPHHKPPIFRMRICTEAQASPP